MVEQAALDSTSQPSTSHSEGTLDKCACYGSGESPAADAADGMRDRAEPSDRQRLARIERLLDEHQTVVFRYAYRLVGCASTAEDITQEVFLRAFRSLHQLRDDAAARGWLLVITRNEFSRWYRKSTNKPADLDSPLCESLSHSQDSGLERSEWIENALQLLPEDFRLVLLMYYFEELSYVEIADQLGIPIGTVMSRLSRAKVHMKSALADDRE